tara:strand:- start:5668 stop:6489 length:822 start_codon:yes stop_codon:yes gene_type:complete
MLNCKTAALILTYNEEINIKSCIDSLKFVNEIYVIDSFSNDNTVEIAKEEGATVLQRKFDTYSSQRNFALMQIPSKIDWVLMFDADERIPINLQKEILLKINNVKNNVVSLRIRRKDIFLGKWIKRSSGYPTWAPRVFRNGFVKVEREINEEYILNGLSENLNEHFLHYPFSKGIHWWFQKHNLYSTMEAEKLSLETRNRFSFFNLFSSDPMIKRKAQKQLFYRLPFRPNLMFFLLFFVRLGFLDGIAGYYYCKLRKTYEWMIEIKMKNIDNL